MATLEEVVQAMMGAPAQESIAEYNPYYQFAPIGEALVKGAVSAETDGQNPRADLWKKSIAASLGAALTGGLRGAGEGRQQELTKGYTEALFGRSDGSNLPKGLFQQVQQQQELLGALDALKQREVRQKLVGDLFKAGAVEDIKAEAKLQNAGKIEAAKIKGKNEAWLGMKGEKPKTPPVTGAVAESGETESPFALPTDAKEVTDESTTKLTGWENPENPFYKEEKKIKKEKLTVEDNLQQEFRSEPIVKKFGGIAIYADAMAKALEDPHAMTDLELVRYSILMIEPMMAVREGEQGAVLASQSIPEKLKGQISKALNGESALTAESRIGLRNLALRAYSSHKAEFDKALSFYKDKAQRRGIDPEYVSYMGEPVAAEKIFGSAMSPAAIVAKARKDPTSVTALERQFMETERAKTRGK